MRDNDRILQENTCSTFNVEAAIKTIPKHQTQNELRALVNVKLNKRIKHNKTMTTYCKQATENKLLRQT